MDSRAQAIADVLLKYARETSGDDKLCLADFCTILQSLDVSLHSIENLELFFRSAGADSSGCVAVDDLVQWLFSARVVATGALDRPECLEDLEPQFTVFAAGVDRALRSFIDTQGGALLEFLQTCYCDALDSGVLGASSFAKGAHSKILKIRCARRNFVALKVQHPVSLSWKSSETSQHWSFSAWGALASEWQAQPIRVCHEVDMHTLEALVGCLMQRDMQIQSTFVPCLDIGLCKDIRTGYFWLHYCGFEYHGMSGTHLLELADAFLAIRMAADEREHEKLLNDQWKILRRLCCQVLTTLCHCQRQYDFIHGDMKFKNIFVEGLHGPDGDNILNARLGDYGCSSLTFQGARFFRESPHQAQLDRLQKLAVSDPAWLQSSGKEEFASGGAPCAYFKLPLPVDFEGKRLLFWHVWRDSGLPVWQQLDVYRFVLELYMHPGFQLLVERFEPSLFEQLWVHPDDVVKAQRITAAIREQNIPQDLQEELQNLCKPDSVMFLNHYSTGVQRFRMDIMDIVLRAFGPDPGEDLTISRVG